jgi:hypothetical protein
VLEALVQPPKDVEDEDPVSSAMTLNMRQYSLIKRSP